MNNPRLYHHIGIAVGAIALIAVLAIALGGGDKPKKKISFESDRVAADITSQAFLIRNKLYECYTAGYDNTDLPDKYPPSAAAGSTTPVELLECPSYNSGVQNLWTGQSPVDLPPPPKDFDKWHYVNAGLVGGRCIRIQPLALADSKDLQNGLLQAASALPEEEVLYNPSSSQKFIVWITLPVGPPSLDCSI